MLSAKNHLSIKIEELSHTATQLNTQTYVNDSDGGFRSEADSTWVNASFSSSLARALKV